MNTEDVKINAATIEELKSQLIENFKEVGSINAELNSINEEIIKTQKEHIKVLEDHIQELRQIIRTYLLKDVQL